MDNNKEKEIDFSEVAAQNGVDIDKALGNDIPSILGDAAAPTEEQTKQITELEAARREALAKRVIAFGRHNTVVRESPKIRRNDPCPCGSGKKYKNCCLDSGEFEQYSRLR